MKLGTIREAVEQLNQGEVVGMPTETVYGLAGRIDLESSIQNIFKIKKRPFFDPLIVHIDSIEMAKTLTNHWNPLSQALAEKFWPGPLTMVLEKSSKVSPMITSGLETVGIRMPSHPLALELIRATQVPLAAPSANRFGRTSPTSANHVISEFPDYEGIVIDGGDCQIGLESTVLSVRFDSSAQLFALSILREGAVLRSHIESALSEYVGRFAFKFIERIDKHLAPGQMKHHYMPEIPLILVEDPDIGPEKILEFAQAQILKMPEVVEGVEIRKPRKFLRAVEIQLPEDPALAARTFYSQLREASQTQDTDILFIRFNKQKNIESWKALQDRLYKAASIILT